MNVFDDLVNELQDEDLLEATVVKAPVVAETETESVGSTEITDAATETVNTGAVVIEEPEEEREEEREEEPEDEAEDDTDLTDEESLVLEELLEEEAINTTFAPESGKKIESKNAPHHSSAAPAAKGSKFYQKRAMQEVSFLQMVEHVMSGVEREQMKIIPKPYDDLKVKKVLHEYITISKEDDLANQAQAEFKLMQETESWHTALTNRDKHISVGQLRRFCETTKPTLSSPALVSLSRFYRNSPFSEQIRNKFELIITRVFSTDIDDDKRELVFTREELIEHITGLYAEWESVPLYSTAENDSELLLDAVKFEEFMEEAESCESFDELVKNDFFNRLRSFKKGLNENFFAPGVISAAIECNTRIGNRYVDLIEKERNRSTPESLEEKYGVLHDQVISDVTSKTLQLVDLLNEKTAKAKATARFEAKAEAKKREKRRANNSIVRNTVEKLDYRKYFAVNKWILIAGALTIVLTFGLYGWLQVSGNGSVETADVVQLDLGDSELNEYLKAPRISNRTLFAVVGQKWKGLSKHEKEKVLKKAMALGNKQEFSKTHLFNQEGRTVAAAQGKKVFVRDVE